MGGVSNYLSTATDMMEYVEIQTTSNTSDFGDLSEPRRGPAATSNNTRGVCCAGRDDDNNERDIIDYVTISSTGNATDFGDLLTNTWYLGCTSGA